MTIVGVYDLRKDKRRIADIQHASLHRPGFGLKPEPALFGSRKWWRAVGTKRLPVVTVTGTITRVYWASKGDWPEYTVVSADGVTTTWTREGDISRYVEGLGVVIRYVVQRHKNRVQAVVSGLDPETKVVVEVKIEDSELRSDPRPPGPGGVGQT
jgi:hypothetical protein